MQKMAEKKENGKQHSKTLNRLKKTNSEDKKMKFAVQWIEVDIGRFYK